MNTEAEKELTGYTLARTVCQTRSFGADIVYVRNLDAAMAEHDQFHDCYEWPTDVDVLPGQTLDDVAFQLAPLQRIAWDHKAQEYYRSMF